MNEKEENYMKRKYNFIGAGYKGNIDIEQMAKDEDIFMENYDPNWIDEDTELSEETIEYIKEMVDFINKNYKWKDYEANV